MVRSAVDSGSQAGVGHGDRQDSGGRRQSRVEGRRASSGVEPAENRPPRSRTAVDAHRRDPFPGRRPLSGRFVELQFGVESVRRLARAGRQLDDDRHLAPPLPHTRHGRSMEHDPAAEGRRGRTTH